MNLGGAALHKLKQFCCKFSQYLVSNFKPLKEFAGTKKNQRHACNMNAFVFVLPCKACLLPFTEQRALSWIWSPHSPQTDHLISFYNTKDAFFCRRNICCKIYKTKTDRETDHFTSFLPDKRYPFCYKARADMICQRNTCLTRPSILCVTHQMSRKNRNYLFGSALRYRMIHH